MNRNAKIALMSMALFLAATAGPMPQAEAQKKGVRPKIISRKDWGANKPVGEGKKHQITFITVHHTATAQKPEGLIGTKMRNLQAFSQRDDKLDTGKVKPAWFDIPYHYYIAADGQIAEGRPIRYAGVSNTDCAPSEQARRLVDGRLLK